MKKLHLTGALCAAVLSLIATTSQASLIGVLPLTPNGTDYQAYYDTVADVTYLADGNYAKTSGFDPDGTMQWAKANAWAASLSINGVTGWRLPDTPQPDASCSGQSGGVSTGFNCTGSELGNLFYNLLGGVADHPISTTHNSNYDNLFVNVQHHVYWSATEYDTSDAWDFVFFNGTQYHSDSTTTETGHYYSAWAVHSGNVGAAPLPAAVWLFSGGLMGLGGVARQRRH